MIHMIVYGVTNMYVLCTKLWTMIVSIISTEVIYNDLLLILTYLRI